jgi:hypothetical protein
MLRPPSQSFVENRSLTQQRLLKQTDEFQSSAVSYNGKTQFSLSKISNLPYTIPEHGTPP